MKKSTDKFWSHRELMRRASQWYLCQMLHNQIVSMSVRGKWIWLFAALAVAFGTNEARAQLALFRDEMQAQLHCPSDEVVWLDFQKKRYYLHGQRLYGRGRTATFVCRMEARKSGYRPSRFGLR